MKNIFSRFSTVAANMLGSPWLFVVNVFLILVWLTSGPFFHFSDTWQLIVNTATTVITYLAVFLIQNTQNRDAKAVHIKLDELIASMEGARNRFVNLESATDEELAELEDQFKRLRESADKGEVKPSEAIVDEVQDEVERRVETTKKDQ